MGDRIDADDLPVLRGERCASVGGVSVHANVCWAAPGFARAPIPVGEPFRVNSDTDHTIWSPRIAVNAAGESVFVWSVVLGAPASYQYDVRGRRFAANGTPLGDEFEVDSFTSGDQTEPRVAIASGGDFVVAWTSEGSPGDDSSGTSVQARRFLPDGTPLFDQFQVNTTTTYDQTARSVVMTEADASGAFVIVWPGNAEGIMAQLSIGTECRAASRSS